ncbi:MAG: type II toxin-antitoxin system RelE/ParE family toxin [Bacteroidota bacterium]|nr:type II toxin-antitoxin system RelE/ParE family toxin [Odoribacter sp.]MDP3645259.1 type II toxin-antitoxin system RelE/ParE family toxin [Bacteroidota bacterium]
MRKVILSKRASNRLEKLLEYLESEWSYKVKKEFVDKLEKSINLIKKFPEGSQRSEIAKELHQLIVTKQTTLYYRYDSKFIRIVAIFDNRMDPKKIREEIKH